MQRPAVTHWGKTTETHWLNTSLINSGFQLPSSCLFVCSAVALVASHIRGSSILPSLGQDHCLGLRTSDSVLDVVKYPGARHRTITESLTDRLSPAEPSCVSRLQTSGIDGNLITPVAWHAHDSGSLFQTKCLILLLLASQGSYLPNTPEVCCGCILYSGWVSFKI